MRKASRPSARETTDSIRRGRFGLGRRAYLKGAGGLAAGLGLAGCMGETGNGSGIEGTEVKLVLAEGGAEMVEFFDRVKRDFEEETGAIFNLEIAPVGVDFAERITQLIQAGDPPEVINGANTSLSILYAAFDLLEPVDDVLETVVDRYGEPPDWTLYQDDDGNELFVPTWSAVSCFWYRPDVLEEAGLSQDFKPDTWEKVLQYEEAVEGLDQPQHGTYMPAAGNAGNSTLEFTMWLRQAGGRYTRYDGENWVAAFDQGQDRERMIEALNFVKEQYQYSPDAGNSTWTDIGHSIETGVSGSVVYTGARPKNYAIDNDRPFAADITTVPGPQGRTSETRAQNTPFLLFKDANTEAAKQFVEFVTREEYFAELHWMTAEVHNAPAYPGLANSDTYQGYLDETPAWQPEQYGIYFDEQQQNGFVNNFETDPPNPYFAVVPQSLQISQMIHEVCVNDANPDNIIDEHAAELTDQLIRRKEQAQQPS